MSPKIRLTDKRQKGISVPETLIVLTILAVVVAFSIPNFTKANVQLQRQNVAQQLKTSFERARSDSIKRNAVVDTEKAKIIINSPTSFSSVLDVNLNGTIESDEIRTTTFASANGAKIVGSRLIFPVTVSFDNRGRAKTIDGTNAAVTPSFVVCGENCTYATANAANSNTLAISASGAVALIEAGQTFFDRLLPKVSEINTGSKINSMAQVEN